MKNSDFTRLMAVAREANELLETFDPPVQSGGGEIEPTQAELWKARHDDLEQKYLCQQEELEWVIARYNAYIAYWEPHAPPYKIGEFSELKMTEESDRLA